MTTPLFHMIAAALGWEIEHIEQMREPIVSQIRRQTPFIDIHPGQVTGCLHTASAYRQGKPVINLIHPQQIDPQLDGLETGDTIEIKGSPHIKFTGSPEIPGGQGTAALAVNMIPRLLNATAGLYSMVDPHLMLILMHALGNDYLVWDKWASIDFQQPGRGRVQAAIEVTNEQVEEIRKRTANGNRYVPEFEVPIVDAAGRRVALVRKRLYIKRKRP